MKRYVQFKKSMRTFDRSAGCFVFQKLCVSFTQNRLNPRDACKDYYYFEAKSWDYDLKEFK